MEHICTLNEAGESECHMCKAKFSSKKDAFEHLEKAHGITKEMNDLSSSDDYAGSKDNETSSESDGSSGVEENESDSGESEEELSDNNNTKISKGKATNFDTEETKNSRKLVAEYMEVLKSIRIPAQLLELQREL